MGCKSALILQLIVAFTLGAQTRNWLLSREVPAEDVLAHFPLQVGNRWIYQSQYAAGDEAKPRVDEWVWEERITKQAQTGDGLIVYRESRVLRVTRGEPDQQTMRVAPLLIRDGCVYELPEVFSEPNLKNAPIQFTGAPSAELRRQIEEASRKSAEDLRTRMREEFLQRVRTGNVTPAFVFPMRVGLMWAERATEDAEFLEWRRSGKAPDSSYHWVVTAKGGRGLCECMTVPADAFDVLYSTRGGPSEFFFQDGVGVSGAWDRHFGTYWEGKTFLVEFIRASEDSPAKQAADFPRVPPLA